MSVYSIRLRRDLNSNFSAAHVVLADGEIGLYKDAWTDPVYQFKIGDGTTDWDNLESAGTAGGEGSVTSIGLSMPTAFSVNPQAPITTSGVFEVTLKQGYDIPTTAKIANWDAAYSKVSGISFGAAASKGVITSMDSTTTSLDLVTAFAIRNYVEDRVATISGGGTAGVSSVGVSMPTGFSVSSSPITSTGVIAISYASGYSLPTTAKQTQWDSAYADKHTHSNKSTLDGISSSNISSWNGKYSKPSGGIPKTDLASAVQTSLDRAETAYSWGNHANAGYVSSSALSSYLPLSGGTLSGNLTIGSSNSNKNLTVNGAISASGNITASGNLSANNIYASGDVYYGYTSDRRLKKQIKTISSVDANSVLMGLNPVTFEWNEIAGKLSDGNRVGKARGFIADEFLQILPNAGKKIWGIYDSLFYEQVIPFLVAGYQAQKAEIEELKLKLNK